MQYQYGLNEEVDGFYMLHTYKGKARITTIPWQLFQKRALNFILGFVINSYIEFYRKTAKFDHIFPI